MSDAVTQLDVLRGTLQNLTDRASGQPLSTSIMFKFGSATLNTEFAVARYHSCPGTFSLVKKMRTSRGGHKEARSVYNRARF